MIIMFHILAVFEKELLKYFLPEFYANLSCKFVCNEAMGVVRRKGMKGREKEEQQTFYE